MRKLLPSALTLALLVACSPGEPPAPEGSSDGAEGRGAGQVPAHAHAGHVGGSDPASPSGHHGGDHQGSTGVQGEPGRVPVFEAGDLRVTQPWSRAVPPRAPVAAGYFALSNLGAGTDRLLGVSSEAAERVEIHEMSEDAAGTMQMRELADGLEVEAGAALGLQPGGYHLMFFGPDATRWQAGARIPAVLHFEHAGDLTLQFHVYAPDQVPALGHDHAHDTQHPETDATL